MLITCLPMTQKQEARAAGGVYNKLVSLKTRFPDGKFWNHQITAYQNNGDELLKRNDESFANSVTSHTCATHTGTAGVGSYDGICKENFLRGVWTKRVLTAAKI